MFPCRSIVHGVWHICLIFLFWLPYIDISSLHHVNSKISTFRLSFGENGGLVVSGALSMHSMSSCSFVGICIVGGNPGTFHTLYKLM